MISIRSLLLGLSLICGCTAVHHEGPPNVLVILVDDLGYSDVTPFGGEIPTPNLQSLAAAGMRFTNFHTAMKCNPTRAMLLTGIDNNLSAEGSRKNYRIRRDVPTLAEQLREAGYQTYIAGKWDAGDDTGERPFNRGFARSFVLLPGTGLHFRAHDSADIRDDGTTDGYSADGKDVAIPGDFYSTRTYTDKIIEFIDQGLDNRQPFFAYAAYTAPHYPLQAPAADIAEFEGVYDAGYAAIHKTRVAQLKKIGLFDAAPWPIPDLPEWESLSDEERAYEAKRMQVYAAMVSNLDHAIGRLLDYLKDTGLANNTLVIFASDNGADGTARGAGFRENIHDNSPSNIGTASSYVTQGINWAQVSSTPYRLVKAHPTEGGTRTPLIVRWPGRIPANTINTEWLRINDIAPTILEAAGAERAATDKNTMSGRSILQTFLTGEPAYADDETRIHAYVERRVGGAYVLKGNYKLVWWKTGGEYGEPMLFDLSSDPAETTDIAAHKPHIKGELVEEWQRYAAQVGSGIAEANPN